jgi:beta-glucosidase
VLPAFGRDDPLRGKLRHINAAMEDGAREGDYTFLDMSGRFVEPSGELRGPAFAPDRLHLTTEGYRIWAETMDPVLTELLR